MYAIFDNVTGEWLTSYKNGEDYWTSGKYPSHLELFDLISEAEKAIETLSATFRENGVTDLDFSVKAVREVKTRYYQEVVKK